MSQVSSVRNLGIIYSQESKRFRDSATGRFLSQNRTLGIIQEGIDQNKKILQTLASDFSKGKIEIDSFALQTAHTVKLLHIYNTAIAKNGRLDTLTNPELKVLNQRVKQQLTSTAGFDGEKFGVLELVKDLLKGDISEAVLKNRLEMFASSAEQTKAYIELENKKADPAISEGMRILQSGKSCSGCIRLSSLNWVTLSDLIMPGENCSCRSNCRCAILYR